MLLAVGLTAVGLWWRRRDWQRLLATGGALGLGLALALGPWGVRNAVMLGRLEVCRRRLRTCRASWPPPASTQWTQTWLTTNQQIYDFRFRVEEEPLEVERLPPSAYDSPEEKARVAALFAKHNANLTWTTGLEAGFVQLARERNARHPLRTFLGVPLARVAAMWVSPRLELLPWSGVVTPVRPGVGGRPGRLHGDRRAVHDEPRFLVLALLGLPRAAWRPGAALIAVYVLLRTALITQMPCPEPRYAVIAFPLLAALAAQLWPPPRPAGAAAEAAPGTAERQEQHAKAIA